MGRQPPVGVWVMSECRPVMGGVDKCCGLSAGFKGHRQAAAIVGGHRQVLGALGRHRWAARGQHDSSVLQTRLPRENGDRLPHFAPLNML